MTGPPAPNERESAAALWAASLGVRPLLLLQLFLFSAAAALLTAKLVLVGIGVLRLSLLRRVARVLIMLGAASALVNLIAMLVAVVRKSTAASRQS
jgi:hypothetical protein